MTWTKEKPTKLGKYKARCWESNYEEYDVQLYLRDNLYERMVLDEHIGENLLDHYHDALCDLEWFGPIN